MKIFPKSWGRRTITGFWIGFIPVTIYGVASSKYLGAVLDFFTRGQIAGGLLLGLNVLLYAAGEGFVGGMIGALVLGSLLSFIDGLRGVEDGRPLK